MSRLLRTLALFLLIPGLLGLASVPLSPLPAAAQEPTVQPLEGLQTVFSVDSFESLSALSLLGSASTIPNPATDDLGAPVLRLTDRTWQSSAAYWPGALDATSSWSSQFTFRLTGHYRSGGDGIAFVVTANPELLGVQGGGLGYGGLANTVAVEIDTLRNPWDSSENHVGLATNGNYTAPREFGVPGDFEDGELWTMWVDYDADAQTLTAWVDSGTLRPVEPVFSEPVDLAGILGTELAFVGLSGGTGTVSSVQDIHRWSLSTADARSLTAEAGADQSVTEGSTVQLDGAVISESSFAEGDYRANVLLDGPISYWPMDAADGSVVRDAVGSVDGAMTGAQWSTESGVTSGDGSIRLDGAGDYVSLGRPASLTVDEFTFEGWFQQTPGASGSQVIVRSRTFGYSVQVRDGELIVYYFTRDCSYPNTVRNTGIQVDDGEWHHVAFTFGPDAVRLHLDGAVVVDDPGQTNLGYCNNSIAFGRDGDHPSLYFDGYFDEFAYYDRALTAEEVETHYCVGSGACGAPVSAEWELIAAEGPPITLSSTTDLSPTFVAPDDGVYTFRLTARQGETIASDIVRVTVTNEDPVVEAAATPAPSDGSVLLTASFSDPGTLDRHRVVVDWGDGSEPLDTSVPAQGNGWGSISAAHVYDAPGTYETTIQVIDDDGGSTAATDQVLITIGGPVRPVPGFALWATEGAGTLRLTGRDSTVEDRSHANGTLQINGDAMAIGGPDATATDPTNETGRNHLVESELSPLTAPPTDYRIGDYQPGGRAALAAGSSYHDLTDECAAGDPWTPSGSLEAGLYYAPCSIDLRDLTSDGEAITIASTATVLISGTGHDITPFLDDLAVLSSAADEPIVIAGEGHAFSGAVVATAGELRVSGVDHDFTCGALGWTVLVSGTGHSFDTSECPAADPQAPDATAVSAPPVVSPNLVAAVINAGGPVAPGDDVTFTATITHSGATLAVPGLLQITNTSDAAVTVNSITATLEVFDTATDAWSPIEGTATASSVRAIVDGAPAESPDLVGTSIAPGAAEVAGLSSTFALSPEQLARLDDPAITDVRINVSVINDGDPSATTQVLRLDDGLAEGIRELGADATEIDATLVSLRSQATELQEPVLTPGESINAELTVSAPAATPIQPGESNRAFLNRLGSLDGASVAAALTGSASGPAGPISIVGSFGSTNVRLPIVAADLTTPASAWQGDSFQISVEVENQGSEPATPTIAVSETELGQLDLASLPGTLAPGERAEVTLTIDVPDDRTTSFNFSLETSWAAGADTVALAPIVGLVQVLEPAAIEVIEYTDVPPDLPAGEIRFLIDVRNSGDDPVTGVVVVDTPSPFPLVEGTLETSRGTATADENGITVDVGDLAGGDAVLITYRLDYGSTAPSVGSVTAQATVSSNELADVLSDDPTVDGVADPTVFTFRGAGGDNGGDPSVIGWYADPTYQGGVIAPGDGTVITEPTTFTLAPDAMTIPDGRTVERWRFIATNDDGAEIELGAGEGFPPATLGEFDPSLVSNGAWRLTLEMVDDIDALGIAWTDVIVDGQLKLGRFSMTYRDLQVALGGLPLTVERTYDTLDRGVVGDFGHGWDLSIADFDVSTNGPLGFAGWQQYSCGGGGLIFAELCFTTSRPHYVTVTWPNGEVETFDFTPEGTSTFFAGQAIAAYSARGERTTSTLSPAPGDTSAFYNGETGVILAGGFGEGGTYDPQRFVLTDRFGTSYILDVDEGLVEAIDRNGNTITVTDDGVISSLGPSIDFTRDAEGRISAITGPDGAEVTYAYDGAGDLVSVVGANDAAFAYTYGTGEAAHYLLEIDDPGTGPNRVLTYDDEGRLTSVTDAEGNTTSIDVDIDARTEIVTSPDGRLTTISSFDERGNALSVNEVYDGANHTSTFTYNASDLPTSRTDALGNTWTGAYDADENLTTYVDPEGNTSAFTYDSYGFPTSVTDAAGNTTGFSYDAAGNMTSITDARNGVQSFTYDGRGNQTSRTDQTGGIWSWAYDTASRVTAATDPLGNTTSYGYDAAGRMTSLVEADGAAWSYSYDVEGNLTSTVDPLGRSTSSVYDARNRLESSTDPAGNTTRYSYDDNDRLVSTTDPTARQWTYTYVFDRLDAATAPDGGVTAYTYDGAGRTLGVIDPLGRTTTYGYDAAGRRTSVTRPAGVGGSATSTWSLDGNGRMVASVNAEGETTSYGLDELGRTVTVTDALGRVSTSTFDAAGNLTASTNPAGESTSYVFDLAGRMTASTDPAGGVTAYGYDAAGNMTSLTDPVDRTWAYGFDELNRQESVTLPSGDASSTTFDAAGQVTTQTSAAGVVTTFDYDPRGLLTSVTDALGNTTAYGYDGAGRRTSMTDGRGNTTTYAFDANGRLLSETDPLGGDVVFGYDLAGQRTSVTDPNGATRTVGFDDAGRMVAAVDAEGRTTTYGYDLVGRRTSMTDGRGITVNSVFDAAGQLTSRVSPNETQSFVYDPAGRRTQMTDASGTTTYAYDPAGRVTEIASPAGTVSYAWNAAGDQTLMGTADALVATSYDTNGFVAETADWAGDTIAYVNDPDGRVTSTTYANGVTTTNSFDAAGRLDRIDHNLAVGSLFFDYTLDANGNRVAVDTVDGTESYTLDALNRLTNATYADGTSEVFGYDAAGNRTSHTDRDGDTVTYNLDQTGALVSDSDGVVYTTDNAGNLVSSSVGAAYVWDDHGRLVEATIDGVTDTAGWNANGDRVELNDATLTLDESGLTTVTDNETDTFLHGEDGFSREGDTWVLTDAVGSVRATVNAAGELVDTIDYTAFGQPLNASSTTFGFAGEYTDPTGLLHLRARPYDPGTGRFLAMDPVQPGSPGTTGWQHYAYAGNNPSTWTDPTGMLVAERSTEHKIVVITAPAVAGTGLAVSKAINIAVGLALINRVDCVILHLVCNSTDEDGPQEEGADSPDVIDLTQHTAEQIANAYGTDANLVRDCMASGDPDSPACQSLPEGAREAATGAADSVGPSLGSDWVQRSASEIPGSTGCDECADRIIDLLGGGEKIRIEPRATPLLGEYRGQMTGWSHHTVVLHQGLVFDAFGPSGGTPVDEWLQLWDSPGTDFRMLE